MKEIMKKHTSRNRRPILIAAAVATWVLATTGATAQDRTEDFSQTIDIGSNGELTVSNISGDIVARGTSDGEVRVQAVKRVHGARNDEQARALLESVRIEVSHTGNRARITTVYPRHDDDHHRGHRGKRSGVSVDYEITVPVGTSVSLKSVSGDVELQNIEGEASANTVSGDVTVEDVANLTLAKTVSGDARWTVRGRAVTWRSEASVATWKSRDSKPVRSTSAA